MDGGVRQTLVMALDGGNWVPATSPNVGVTYNLLASVSCINASSCTAVGGYRDSGGSYQTLVLSSDGTNWTTMTSPNTGTEGSFLNSVSCVTVSSCIAVGSFSESFVSQTSVLSWDGANWTTITSPNIGAGGSYMSMVSCSTESSCTAVGSYRDNGVGRTLAMSLTGPEPTPTTTPTTTVVAPSDAIVPTITG